MKKVSSTLWVSAIALILAFFTFGCEYVDADQSADGSIDSVNRAATLVVDKVNGPYKTIAAGVAAAVAGDTILVKKGTYSEKVTMGKSGTASAYITLKGESGAIINNGKSGNAITISSKSYIKIDGIEITNCTQGVEVIGSSTNIYIQNCYMHAVGKDSNELVIYVHGTGSITTPASNIFILNNELSYNRTGNSEVCTVNGNVDGFTIQGNYVHHNDNIGIDCIGYESGNGPTATNYARNGLVCDNVVDYISCEGGPGFARNPTYSVGDYSSDGIYVDGGASIIIERNKVSNCDVGIELASEHKGKYTQNITIRDNFVSGSYQGNIQMGGWKKAAGNAKNIYVYNNTTYQSKMAEVYVQFNTSSVQIKNNIFVAKSGLLYIENGGSNNSGFTVTNNMYYGASTSSSGSWSDTAGKFTNPLLISATNLHIQATSPAKNAGVTADYGTLDIDKQARANGTVDIGADEL